MEITNIINKYGEKMANFKINQYKINLTDNLRSINTIGKFKTEFKKYILGNISLGYSNINSTIIEIKLSNTLEQ